MCAQWIDAFSVCQISAIPASLLGQWPVLMSAINLWMQHYSIIPPTWARSRDLAWSGLSGLHPRKFHYHNINTSRCQDLDGFLFTLLLRSFFLLWSRINPLGQVGPGLSGQKWAMNFTWDFSGPRSGALSRGAGQLMFTLKWEHILCNIIHLMFICTLLFQIQLTINLPLCSEG